jgi:tetratricopeptide (TPR) repeat protein
MNAAIPAGFVLERDRRLSESMLWRLQRKFFSEQTIDAWRQGIVPHYVTSNTFIARAYARVVFGYVRDVVQGTAGGYDASEPLYVLELGAGSGRFSYHFLKHFFALLERSPLREVAVTFVMSDLPERNLEFWRAHACLQPFVVQGRLDFALVDLSQLDSIALVESGRTLAEGALRNPLVVLANYVLDGIEQDAFYLNGGVLHESLVSLYSEREEADPDDPGILQRAHTGFSNQPADGHYYPEPGFNRILDHYRERFSDTHFLMPAQALRHLEHLRRIGNGRLLLVSADKGNSREEDFQGRAAPEIVSHGSISLMVNYHAIGLHVEQQGGRFFTTPQRHASLHVCAALFDDSLSEGGDAFPETALAFAEDIGQTGPDDFFMLKRFIQGNARHLSLEQLLAYMRLSGWDAANFWGCYDAFMRHADESERPLRDELVAMANAVWDMYYPLGEERDLAFALASLMHEIECYPEAITYLQHSRRLYGDDAGTLYNIAMCFYSLGQLPQASQFVAATLDLDPAYEPAQVMSTSLQMMRQEVA